MKKVIGLILSLVITVSCLFLTACGKEEELPPEKPYVLEEITYNVEGVNIFGETALPASYEGKLPLVILSHGSGNTHTNMMNIAKKLAEKGYACIAIDYSGVSPYSKSDGEAGTGTVETSVRDLKGALDFMLQKDYVDGSKVFLYGHSRGGRVTANAIEDEEFAAKISGAMLLAAGLDWLIEKGESSYKKPIVLFHGDEDTTVDVELSKKSAEIYENAELVIFEGVGHTPAVKVENEMIELMDNFMKKLMEE